MASVALATDSFDTQAIGRQSNSRKETMPAYSFGTGSRDVATMKVYISAKHQKSKGTMNSPGPVYSQNTTVGAGPQFGFGTDEQRKHSKAKYPDSSVDLTCASVDTQAVKFHATKAVHFGTESRMSCANAEVVRVHPGIMFGQESPGALEYNPNEQTIIKKTAEYSFGPGAGPQTTGKIVPRITLPLTGTPRTVGPGSNTVQPALGEQANSARKSAPAWGMGNPSRREGQGQTAALLDTSANLSSIGKQVVSSARSAPQCGFGSATRDHVARTALITTQADRGPAAAMPKPNFHLDLPPPSKNISKPGM